MSFAIYILQGVSLLDLLAVSLIIPLVPNHVRQLGGNHIYVGLLGSIYATFQLGSGPLIGSLSDLKGRKTILFFTLLVCSGVYATLGITKSIIVILLTRALLGLFKQTQLLTKALVPDYEKNQLRQSEIYGKMAAISGVGMTLGPTIGGHIVEDNPEYGFTLIAIAVGAVFALNAAIVHIYLPKTETKPTRRKGTKNILFTFTSSIKQSVVELYKMEWSKYWDIFMLKSLIGFAMGVYYSSYSMYLKSQYELSPKYIGYVISFQAVVGSIASYFMGYISSYYKYDDDYSLRNYHVFILQSVSLIGLLISMNIYMYSMFLIPLAIANAVGRLVSLEMILKRGHGDHRGTLIGASNSVRSLTGVVSPLVAGLIGQYIGIGYVIYASLTATVIGAVLSYQIRYKRVKED